MLAGFVGAVSVFAHEHFPKLVSEDRPQGRPHNADRRPLIGIHTGEQLVQKLRHVAASARASEKTDTLTCFSSPRC